MEKKSNGKTISLIILGLLTAFGMFVEIISEIKYSAYYSSGAYFNLVTYCATSLLLMYYAVAGYKKPHGNLLKYLFLLFTLCCLGGILSIDVEQSMYDIAYNYIRGIVVVITAYVSGRLDRYKQNVILMSIIGVLMLASSILQVIPDPGTVLLDWFWCFTFFLLWVDLMFAYILRYKEHKEAGLEDKK